MTSTRTEIEKDWKELLSCSVVTASQLVKHLTADANEVYQVIERYPMRISPYYLSLIQTIGDPIWKQAVPDIAEMNDPYGTDDPLTEEKQSPVPSLIHRYPDRVVFLVSAQCAVFCRYCMRKRKIGVPFAVTEKTIRAGLDYIQNNTKIRDVILSGGDPLLLDDALLHDILKKIRSMSHVQIIRIHTRVPCTLPHRVTSDLADILKKFHPLYINTHFNHPREITPESTAACNTLADAGIPLGCQTVLLKGVNDNPEIMKRLMHQLLMIRVKPYYIHQLDLAQGTSHFRTSPETGLDIMNNLRGHTSGMCVPHFMIDLPGGGGKIPLVPEHVTERKQDKWIIKNYEGKIYEYSIC
ncbi:MAG: KamA family radical SAM protein [Desulfobacterales bacterium]|nr:KamA family radical SAM protein [Desulfobacterales bacterium]